MSYEEALDAAFTPSEKAEFKAVVGEMYAAHPEMASMSEQELETLFDPVLDQLYPEGAGKVLEESGCGKQVRRLYIAAVMMGAACATVETGIGAIACAAAIANWGEYLVDLDECYNGG